MSVARRWPERRGRVRQGLQLLKAKEQWVLLDELGRVGAGACRGDFVARRRQPGAPLQVGLDLLEKHRAHRPGKDHVLHADAAHLHAVRLCPRCDAFFKVARQGVALFQQIFERPPGDGLAKRQL
jgi:hypothetical protein